MNLADSENFAISNINYILCSDDYLLDINRKYLNHDYYTDVITFQNSETGEPIEADIFISIDRVKENASKLNSSLSNEIHRVLVHGLLHLFGHKDNSDSEKMAMRKKEDSCLSLRVF